MLVSATSGCLTCLCTVLIVLCLIDSFTWFVGCTCYFGLLLVTVVSLLLVLLRWLGLICGCCVFGGICCGNVLVVWILLLFVV